jgi:predicted nucleotidyltransferase
MNKQTIINYLKNHKQILNEKYGINKLGLYGSYARDEATSSSDVDIFYDTNDKFSIGILEFSSLIQKMEDDLKTKVDLVSLESMNPVIKYYAKQDFTYV